MTAPVTLQGDGVAEIAAKLQRVWFCACEGCLKEQRLQDRAIFLLGKLTGEFHRLADLDLPDGALRYQGARKLLCDLQLIEGRMGTGACLWRVKPIGLAVRAYLQSEQGQ